MLRNVMFRCRRLDSSSDARPRVVSTSSGRKTRVLGGGGVSAASWGLARWTRGRIWRRRVRWARLSKHLVLLARDLLLLKEALACVSGVTYGMNCVSMLFCRTPAPLPRNDKLLGIVFEGALLGISGRVVVFVWYGLVLRTRLPMQGLMVPSGTASSLYSPGICLHGYCTEKATLCHAIQVTVRGHRYRFAARCMCACAFFNRSASWRLSTQSAFFHVYVRLKAQHA